jgi:hypothetical protein
VNEVHIDEEVITEHGDDGYTHAFPPLTPQQKTDAAGTAGVADRIRLDVYN